jgi:hypothetical protein
MRAQHLQKLCVLLGMDIRRIAMTKPICLAWTETSTPPSLYDSLMAPAITGAGMIPHLVGSAFPSLEAFLLAECALLAVDVLSSPVAYAIGLRESRGRKTVVLLPESAAKRLDGRLAASGVRYSVLPDRAVTNVDEVRRNLIEKLGAATETAGPLKLLDALERPPIPDVSHAVTDRFRDRVDCPPDWPRDETGTIDSH